MAHLTSQAADAICEAASAAGDAAVDAVAEAVAALQHTFGQRAHYRDSGRVSMQHNGASLPCDSSVGGRSSATVLPGTSSVMHVQLPMSLLTCAACFVMLIISCTLLTATSQGVSTVNCCIV